jgi:hypothetical protein
VRVVSRGTEARHFPLECVHRLGDLHRRGATAKVSLPHGRARGVAIDQGPSDALHAAAGHVRRASQVSERPSRRFCCLHRKEEMSDTQKHQINELMKEQMRLTENLAIQKDKARLAANSLLWELPSLILFVLTLVVVLYILTILSVRAGVPSVEITLNDLGPLGVSTYGPFTTTQIGVALYYPSLYDILNALAVYADQLSPTGAEFVVKSTTYVFTQASGGGELSGATLTSHGYAGTLENIMGTVDTVANLLYDVWYSKASTQGINAGKDVANPPNDAQKTASTLGINAGKDVANPPNDAQKTAWSLWMQSNIRWLAPNFACLLLNPLLRCGGVFTPVTNKADLANKKADATMYILNSGPWMAVISHGLCGYAILEQDGTPDDMFGKLFGGTTDRDGVPFPCGNIKDSTMIQWGTSGAGLGGSMSMFVTHFVHGESAGSQALVGLLTLACIAGGAAAGVVYGKGQIPTGCE